MEKKRYWLKGGIVGIVVSALFTMYQLGSALSGVWPLLYDIPQFFYTVFLKPAGLVSSGIVIPVTFLINAIIFFIPASIIGSLIGSAKKDTSVAL